MPSAHHAAPRRYRLAWPGQVNAALSAWRDTVSTVTTQPARSPGTGEDDVLHRGHDVIHLGGEAAVVVPVDEYRRLRALEKLASPQELEDAEAAATLAEYREWSAAGRPGAIPHTQARRLLLGEDQ
jgi:hypothetical protein